MAEQKSIGSKGVISISITGVCIVIIIGLQSATIHRLNVESNDNEESQQRRAAIVQLPLQDELRELFPGMFETKAEIMKRVQLWNNSTEYAANIVADALTQECDFCENAAIEFHTCGCTVGYSFKPLATAIDQYGNNRTLVQLEDAKQYFLTEDCLQDSANGNCHCKPMEWWSLAVYVVADGVYATDYCITGKVCKSLNK